MSALGKPSAEETALDLERRSAWSRSKGKYLRDLSIPGVLLALIVLFSLASDRFLSASNLLKIVNDATVVGILAIGMTLVLILAGIDLSVGATVSLTTVVLGSMLVDLGLPVGLALPVVLSVGCVVGLANGLLIVNTAVPPILVTLGTLSIVQSISSFLTEGAIISLVQFDAATYFGQGYIGAIPFPPVILLVLAIVCHVLLTRTSLGTKVRAIGSNRSASELMGLDVSAYTVGVYVMSGLLASIAGLVVAGRLAAGSSEAGLDLELSAITAAVLGGASLSGGSGSIAGTLGGALILSVLFNGLILTGVPFFYQLVLTGLVLVVAVAFNEALARRA